MRFLLVIFIFLFLGSPIFTQEEEEPESELDIDELRSRILNESPNEILSLSIKDTDVSFFMTGSWKGELQFHPGYSISPYTSGFTPLNTPIFMQEADITLALWINNKWFVEANFLDDYSMNTYRAGYQGGEGAFLKYFGIGNTGLDFPSFSYLDLGGDSPSSFGLYSNFGTDKLDFHALFRYDTSAREERVFSGGRERTYSYVKPENIVRGISFVLPDTDIDSQITVYIEDEKGDIRDLSENRRWRQALSSEYAFSRSAGLLEFSVRSKGMIAVSYSKNVERPWNVSMGSYDGTQNGFLTSIQNWFDAGRQTIKLENYPQAGNRIAANGRPGEIVFNSGAALVIYEPGSFSPFERLNRYDAPSSTSEQASFVRVSDETKISGYELLLFDSFSISQDFLLFFSETRQRGVYELVKTGSNTRRDPESMYPLAGEYAQIYLPGTGVFSGDAVLRFTNFNNTSGYFIGTDVVPGSVQVWRSGIQDTNFSYNSSTGEVVIRGSAVQNELIRVTYLKRSEETRLGSIAAGVGFIYNKKNGPFSFHTALGLRFNLSDEAYTQEDSSSTGNVGLSVKAAWDYPDIKAHIAGGFSFDRIDTTDLYRAIGMEGNEFITSLPADTSFISNPPSSIILQSSDLSILNRSDLIYRDYNNDNILGHNLMPIDWSASVVSGVIKPYAAKDPMLGNAQVVAAEFNLDSGNWTGFQSPVNNFSDVLSRAGEIEIPFRFYDFNEIPASGFKLVIQIGSLSGKDFSFAENTSLIWERILFSDNLSVTPDDYYTSVEFNNDARIARFKLNEEDRRKLGNANFIRLIAVNENTSSNSISGRVLLASPIVRGAGFKAVVYDGNETSSSDNVRAIETIDTGQSLTSTYPDTGKFHITGNSQRVLRIDWENTGTGIAAGVEGMTGQIPLSDYRELSFFVKIRDEQIKNNSEFIRFIISAASGSFDNSRLDASIPMNMFETEKWTKVTIRYQGENRGISVSGVVLPNASFTYTPERRTFDSLEKRSVYFAFLVNPRDVTQKLEDGTIFLDEIILEDSIMVYRMNAGAGFEYTKRGDFVSIKNTPVFSDFYFNTALESEAHASAEKSASDFFGSVVSRSGIGISFFGVKLSGNFSFTAAENTFLWSADHEISRSIGKFSFKESFYAAPDENKARHNFNMGYQSNFHTRFEADALYDLSKLRQNWKFDIGYRPKNEYIPSFAFNTNALWTSNSTVDNSDNYGSLLIRSWDDMIPDLGEGAETRRTQTQFVINQRTKPVGAVLTLEGNTFFSGMNNITRLENSAFLNIPVVIKKAAMNFRAGRGFKQHINYSGNDVIEDTVKFFDSVKDSMNYWKTIPFYSLFDPKLNDLMDEGLKSSPFASFTQYTSFNDHFSARVNLTSIYNLLSFFIPVRYVVRIDRVIEQKMDTRSDNLNIGAGVGFSSVNMFGAMGYLPIFKFYQADEFSHGFDVVFTVPRDGELQWRLQSVLNASFRGHSGGVVSFLNTLTFRSDMSWLESFTAFWEAPTKRNVLSIIYDWILKGVSKQSSWLNLSSFINPEYEQLRRETLELTFDKSRDHLRWSISAGHEEIIRILGRLNFNAFVKFKAGKDLLTEVLLLDLLIGVGLRISF